MTSQRPYSPIPLVNGALRYRELISVSSTATRRLPKFKVNTDLSNISALVTDKHRPYELYHADRYPADFRIQRKFPKYVRVVAIKIKKLSGSIGDFHTTGTSLNTTGWAR